METNNLLSIMHRGGAVMWPLFILLIATIVIVCERTVTFWNMKRRGERQPKEKLESPLSLLDLIATISPILGFLGTVTGMINAFQSVSQASSVRLQVVAEGLYEALFTTAFGLIVSILSTVFGFLLDMAIGGLCADEGKS